MISIRKDQNGSHLIIIIFALLLIAAIGFVGWRVLKKTNKSSSSPTTTNQSKVTKLEKIDVSKLKFDQEAAITNPISDGNGPYFHQVFTAISSDGLNFTPTNELVADKASVPDIAKLTSGQLVMYAVDGAARSKSGLLMAVSDDNGASWKTGSVQLTSKQVGAADPEILLTSDGKLRLFYIIFPGGMGAAGKPDPSEKNQVYSATSSDGINFSEEPGIRFEYPAITDPDVIKIGKKWFMYVAQGTNQVYATSTDGNSYTYGGVIRTNGSVSKTVPIEGGKFRQFYCGMGIVSATSADGIEWSNDPGTRVGIIPGKILCDPSPVQLSGNNWLMLYKTSPAQNAPKP